MLLRESFPHTRDTRASEQSATITAGGSASQALPYSPHCNHQGRNAAQTPTRGDRATAAGRRPSARLSIRPSISTVTAVALQSPISLPGKLRQTEAVRPQRGSQDRAEGKNAPHRNHSHRSNSLPTQTSRGGPAVAETESPTPLQQPSPRHNTSFPGATYARPYNETRRTPVLPLLVLRVITTPGEPRMFVLDAAGTALSSVESSFDKLTEHGTTLQSALRDQGESLCTCGAPAPRLSGILRILPPHSL